MERSNSAAAASALLSPDLNVFRALEAHGVDAAAVFRRAGCDPALLHVPETRISNRVKQRLYEIAERETEDPCFGIEVGKQVRGVALHALGYAWLASATLGEAVARAARHTRVLTDFWRAEVRDEGRGVRLMTDYLARRDRGDVAAQVKSALIGRLPVGAPTQATIVCALGTSARTLHRRLADRGTSFEKLLDETRRELGTEYLRRNDYSVGEVAYLLGFAEASSFNRAFRRWTGKSPSEFRQAHAAAAP